MPNYQLPDTLSIWLIFFLTIVLLWLADEAGYRLGCWVQSRWPDRAESGVGTLVGASLALLGFMLAFITGIEINLLLTRFDLVVSETNAIESTYDKTVFLEEPIASESRDLLREYVDLRLKALEPRNREMAIQRSEQIHQELWKKAAIAAKQSPTPIMALYISSLGGMMDLHVSRVNYELEIRVPPIIVVGLYVMGALTLMLIGVYSSYTGKRNQMALVGMILILSMVFILVVDLDRTNQGLIRIPQTALFNLQQRLLLHP